ncbi:unnamed protein product, partial [marine sediment metagenome]
FEFVFTDSYHEDTYIFTAQVKRDSMTGMCIDRRGVGTRLVGKRFLRKIDVTGKWSGKTEGKLGTCDIDLALVHKDKVDIRGEFNPPLWYNFSDAKFEKGTLSFSAMNVSESNLNQKSVFTAVVKGDIMEGTINHLGKHSKFAAQRGRKWAEPIEIFNGKNLDGWKSIRHVNVNNWKVIDSVLSNTAAGAHIVHERKFQDFKLHLEFKVPEHSNSGVYLRGRYEIQIEDYYGKPANSRGCGGIYSRIKPLVNACKPHGQWQTLDATL